jgi:hypothetical protein
MNNDNKAARYGNTGKANVQKLQRYFITIASRMKAGFVRLAVWVSIAIGA